MCFWKPAESGGYMFQFYTMGKNPAGLDDAFGLIADSMKYERAPK